ncbi:glycosyltransferase [Sphingobium sp. YR768]|uniref:glycosyltransferase n=1 Tax=Sphingobium sp. YR768 TaxID=1884365 RepID=UPI0008ABF04F|nr:glycosyltransferase [Sphingobium sp. YR768]SES17501.1 Predicted glycosyl transferase [Sphingobium sp. YR768]
MTRRPIGYYVHHHGAGHRARAEAIAAASDWPIVLLGTGLGKAGIDLSDDRPMSGRFDGVDGGTMRPAALHYAPLDHEGVRSRVARITHWIEAERPAMMVVDVSAEVTMLSRLASVPTIYVRLNGERSDTAHLDVFRSATALLAPFHRDLEMPTTPAWIRDKTCYLPGITAAAHHNAPHDNRILMVIGRGGPPGDGEAIARAARACPDMHWRVIGPVTAPRDRPINLDMVGWVEDPAREIADAGVIIGAAGDGLVGAVLAADRPFLCMPEERPYDEQQATALALDALGAAIMLETWPPPDQWPSLISRARALPPHARKRLHDPHGVKAAANWLATMAAAAVDARKTIA